MLSSIVVFNCLMSLQLATAGVAASSHPTSLVAAVLAATDGFVVDPGQPAPDVVEDTWPRVIKGDKGTLTIYPPSFQSWSGTQLAGSCALSVTKPDGSSKTFGTMSFTATTEVNKLNRMVTLTGIQVSGISLPENPAAQSMMTAQVASESQGKVLHVALDRLEASVPGMSVSPAAPSAPLQNTPPAITISPTPTVLVPVQGKPVLRPLDGTALSRVINTPMLVLKDTRGNFWLKIADGWMSAPALAGPWGVASSNDPAFASVAQWAQSQPSINLLAPSNADGSSQTASLAKSAPMVLVATTPTELLVTNGAPEWQAAGDSGLLYVSNTSANIFQLKSTGAMYVLISGRWFTAASMAGPWSYVPGAQLPAAFAMIPQDSPKENVLASVAGTAQASEALTANSVPQMTHVPLTQQMPLPATTGDSPVWQPIGGTSVKVLANCATPVFQLSDGSCYAVQNGVWFTASQFNAPWVVATSVPSDIYTIPPSSPYYYVTFVRIYNATANDVLVGYTPGYFGSYVQDGTVVYGTGYSYAPYYATGWVPAPVTYGCGAAVYYSPWAGWGYGFGAGMVAGWEVADDNWVCGPYPYWGPYYGAYGAHGAYAWGPGGWAATSGNVYHQWGDATGMTRSSAGYNAWTGNAWSAHTATAYNSATGAAAAGQRGYVQNAYTGNWAEGARGAGYNPTTGNYAAAKGGAVGKDGQTDAVAGTATVGNTKTGDSATVSGVKTQNGSWGAVQTDNGTTVEHDGNVYGLNDGNAYAYNRANNSWQRYDNGTWNNVTDANTTRALNNQAAQRADGDWRANNANRWQSGGDGFNGERASNGASNVTSNYANRSWTNGYNGGGNAGRSGRAGGGGGGGRR